MFRRGTLLLKCNSFCASGDACAFCSVTSRLCADQAGNPAGPSAGQITSA